MIADLLDSNAVADRARVAIPWLLVAGSAILVVVILYVLFGAYLPARHRIALLEAELHQVYLREAELQTKLAAQEQQARLREKAITAERDELARRLERAQRPATPVPVPRPSPSRARRP
jgi:type II secretory pathway component PulM